MLCDGWCRQLASLLGGEVSEVTLNRMPGRCKLLLVNGMDGSLHMARMQKVVLKLTSRRRRASRLEDVWYCRPCCRDLLQAKKIRSEWPA